MSPSVWAWNLAVEKSPQVASRLAAFVPSPNPVAPWHDLQCLLYRSLALARFSLLADVGFFMVLNFAGTTHSCAVCAPIRNSNAGIAKTIIEILTILLFILLSFKRLINQLFLTLLLCYFVTL